MINRRHPAHNASCQFGFLFFISLSKYLTPKTKNPKIKNRVKNTLKDLFIMVTINLITLLTKSNKMLTIFLVILMLIS